MTQTAQHEMEPDRSPFDEFVDRANALRIDSYDAFIELCNQTHFPGPEVAGLDPFTQSYRDQVLQHYLLVAGIPDYQPYDHERANYTDTHAPLHRQFPFMTRDPKAIGRYLMGVGYMVSNIGVPAGSYIVEYGVGWGHIALALGQSGYDVACVDIESSFVELVNHRAQTEQASVRAYCEQFGFNPDDQRPVDAVIFFEAFHHSIDHIDLTFKLQAMLRPGGRLLLGGEPIYSSFPVDWGLRPDGQAIWAVRSFKWMELGFRESYLLKLLLRHGFSVARHNNPDIGPLGLLYVGTKLDGTLEPGATLLPAEEEATWNPSGEAGLKFATSQSSLSVADLVGWSELTLQLHNYVSQPTTVTLQLGEARHTETVAPISSTTITLPIAHGAGPLVIQSDTHCPKDLGLNDDARHLGIALLSLSYR